jgi:hypothetical protein
MVPAPGTAFPQRKQDRWIEADHVNLELLFGADDMTEGEVET